MPAAPRLISASSNVLLSEIECQSVRTVVFTRSSFKARKATSRSNDSVISRDHNEAQSNGLRDDPPFRLVSILDYLAKRREMPVDGTILPILDDWARDAGVPAMSEALNLAMRVHREYFTGVFAEMSSLEQTLRVPIYSGTRELLEAWMASREHMAEEFLRDPLTYLDPVRYLRNRDRFVACPMYLFDHFGPFR